jgi:hypothetical protein
MIWLRAFMRRKRAAAVGNELAAQKKTNQPPVSRPPLFTGGAKERTQDLLSVHDGERVGFRKPVQG